MRLVNEKKILLDKNFNKHFELIAAFVSKVPIFRRLGQKGERNLKKKLMAKTPPPPAQYLNTQQYLQTNTTILRLLTQILAILLTNCNCTLGLVYFGTCYI